MKDACLWLGLLIWVLGFMCTMVSAQTEYYCDSDFEVHVRAKKLTGVDFLKAVLWPLIFMRLFFWLVVYGVMAIVGPLICIGLDVMWQESKFYLFLNKKI